MFVCKTEIYISYKINLNIHIDIYIQEQEDIDKKRLIEIVCLFLLSLSVCLKDNKYKKIKLFVSFVSLSLSVFVF